MTVYSEKKNGLKSIEIGKKKGLNYYCLKRLSKTPPSKRHSVSPSAQFVFSAHIPFGGAQLPSVLSCGSTLQYSFSLHSTPCMMTQLK